MIGTRLGPYEIIAQIGEGGMGVVFRAKDFHLGREVALKVLPEAFTADPERAARFEREAKLLAQLNHPNIAQIHGLEIQGDTRALVMELVEGPTLAERLESGSLPLVESLSIARQIAEALEEAHEKGIIHRDLKPQNIKASMEGKVKVLDFGLAKAMDPAGESGVAPASASQLAASPTMTLGATVQGMILGTAAYMSPEQARGVAVDRRADIWAFGVVLYEMLTGRRLFEGELVTDVLANVIKHEIDLDALPVSTPPAVRRLLRRCLERNPKNRLHSIADARLELEHTDERDEQPTVAFPARHPALTALPWALAIVALALAGWSWLADRSTAAAPRPIVASIPPPDGASFLVDSGFAVSPDGSSVAFAARDEAGVDRLWLRSLSDGSARPIPGTENGKNPFWSPDGGALGFFDDRHLKRVTLSDSVVETYRDMTAVRPSGSWSPQGVIVFASGRGLFRVPAAGGEAQPLSPGGAESAEAARSPYDLESLSPSFLPDGHHFLYLVRDYSDSEAMRELRVGSLDNEPHRTVMRINSNAVYSPSGEILWWQDGHLRAQPFDLERLELGGAPRLLRSGVQFDPRNGLGMFSVAADGTLVVREGGVVSGDQLALVDRSGADLGLIGPPGNFYHPRLSPDGSKVAVDQSDETNRGDLWIFDVARRTGTRWTSQPEDESSPVWSPDGRQLAFSSLREAKMGAIHVAPVHRIEDEKLLRTHSEGSLGPLSWPVPGTIVAEFGTTGRMGRFFGLGAVSPDDGSYQPITTGRFSELNGALSPDGRFLAYDTDETGRWEVYVQPFPDVTDRWRVSTDGGSTPFWRSDGGELYFLDGGSRLSVVSVRSSPNGTALSFGEPETLFPLELKASRNRQIDTVDGRTFLVNRTVSGVETAPLTLVVNALSPESR